jgi:hypothetical protein
VKVSIEFKINTGWANKPSQATTPQTPNLEVGAAIKALHT